MAVFASKQRELDRGGGLARALEADQHHHRRRGAVVEAFRISTEKVDELRVHLLDHLLRSRQARRDLSAGEPFPHGAR